MFNIRNADIARYLNVHRTSITKLESGETGDFGTYKDDKTSIYEVIFDPSNKKSPASKHGEQYLLESLQNTVEDLGFKEIMKDCWNEGSDKYKLENYEAFVIEMLERIANNHPPKQNAKSKPNNQMGDIPGGESEFVLSLPFERNKFFTGRSDKLEHIRNNFSTFNANKRATQVIHGLDGMGKTDLALEYVYDTLASNKDMYNAICWIDSANKDAIEKSCCDFLAKVGETATLDVAVSRLTHWLQNNNEWLLILDDVNEDELVERLLPKMGTGHILITAQHDKDFIISDSPIKLEWMNEDEAIKFLIKRTSFEDCTNAAFIAKRLGYLPLALEQAAALICEARISFNEFLGLIEENGLELFDSEDSTDGRRATIHTVWSITLDRLSATAKRLLYCIAFMSADSVELDWFEVHAQNQKAEQKKPDIFYPTIRGEGESTGEQFNASEIYRKYDKNYFDPELATVFANRSTFIKTRAELERYSIIKLKNNDSFAMHVLLQEVIRNSKATLSHLLSVWETLKSRCDDIDRIYPDYRVALPLAQALPLIKNICAFLICIDEFVEKIDKAQINITSTDIDILNFQYYSFFAQYLTLRGEAEKDERFFEDADELYSISCKLTCYLYIGEEKDLTSRSCFAFIQEKHRHLRVNLILKRIDKAKDIYEEVRGVLKKAIEIKPYEVEEAFRNYANLWKEFGFEDIAKEAYDDAQLCVLYLAEITKRMQQESEQSIATDVVNTPEATPSCWRTDMWTKISKKARYIKIWIKYKLRK